MQVLEVERPDEAPASPRRPRPWHDRRVRWTGVALGAVGAGMVLTGTAALVVDGAAPSRAAGQAAPAAAPSASAEQPAEEAAEGTPLAGIRAALAAAPAWTGTATYRVSAPSGAEATVTLVRAGDRTRVDVRTGGSTASLVQADAGWVACATVPDAATPTECVLVAPAGEAPPAAFDPGIGTLVTTTLPDLAKRQDGLTLTRELGAGTGLDPARCVAAAGGTAAGEYCLTDGGLLRRAEVDGGRLDLVWTTGAVHPGAFAAPAAPVPLTAS